MEDGEIPEDALGSSYRPEFEWQGGDNGLNTGWVESSMAAGPSSTNYAPPIPVQSSQAQVGGTTLRLLRVWPVAPEEQKQAHMIMSRPQQLAIIDGYTQVQFGRDAAPPGTDIPRIRLKEMEVSKLHATIYWDGSSKSWSVVDMGSKHGTFVRPDQANTTSAKTTSISNNPGTDPRGQRLSAPRMSSIPRVLKHLDNISLGNTTFVAHLHEDRLPCEVCATKGGDEISLFYVSKTQRVQDASRKRKLDALEPPPPSQGDARKSLNLLKRNLLSKQNTPLGGPPSDSRTYVDRSARRRALHPDTPDVAVVSTRASMSAPSSRPVSPPVPEPVSAPPTPLSSSNIGHRLLMKQGWTPGTVLGQESPEPDSRSIALAEPIQVSVRTSRAGLGVVERQPPAQSTSSWKETAQQRRWADLHSGSTK